MRSNEKDRANAPMSDNNMNEYKSASENVAPGPRGRILDRLPIFLLGAAALMLVLAIPDSDMVPTNSELNTPALREPLTPFTFPTLDGAKWSPSSHKGHVILVNFWATWCPPCRAETPDLVRLAGTYKSRGLDVAGVSMDNSDLAGVRDFRTQYQVSYPILLADPRSTVAASVSEFPTTELIDRDGRVAATFVGRLDLSQVQAAIEQLLKEKTATGAT